MRDRIVTFLASNPNDAAWATDRLQNPGWRAWACNGTEFEEAIPILKTIGTPDNRWGVWPAARIGATVSFGALDRSLRYRGKDRAGQSRINPKFTYLMSENS